MAEAKSARAPVSERPLSPHLQIYRMTNSMLMSIVHRITGGALYFGTVLLAWWLVAAASGPKYFDFVNGIFGSVLGKLVLLGYTWALFHHMVGGLRHFIWDTGRGYDLKTVNLMSNATVVLSVLLTAIVWFAAYKLRGGF